MYNFYAVYHEHGLFHASHISFVPSFANQDSKGFILPVHWFTPTWQNFSRPPPPPPSKKGQRILLFQ